MSLCFRRKLQIINLKQLTVKGDRRIQHIIHRSSEKIEENLQVPIQQILAKCNYTLAVLHTDLGLNPYQAGTENEIHYATRIEPRLEPYG
jgi:hypothetical protein